MSREPYAIDKTTSMRLSGIINKLKEPTRALKYKRLRGIKSRKEFSKIIEHERERADRNCHKVSLVVFNLDSFPDCGEERKQIIKNINLQKRSIDNVGWIKKHSVGIILPYTSFHGARKFSVRVSRTLNFIMPDSFCRLYTYPFKNKSEICVENFHENLHDGAGDVSADIENASDQMEDASDEYIQNKFASSL